jgi:hypothetical protein
VVLNGFEAAFLTWSTRMALRATAARELANMGGDLPPVFLPAEDTA